MPTGHALIEHIHSIPVIPHSLAIWGLGQMGIALKGSDGVIVIDPCLSDSMPAQPDNWWRRGYPPPIQPGDLTGIACYLATHEHGDHLDTATAAPAAQASPDMTFIVSGWCVDKLAQVAISQERIIIPPNLEPIQIPGTSARLTAIPSAHYEKQFDADKGYRWLGYLIEWNGITFYHAGDTIIYPGYIDTLRSLPRPDIAMIPVNGRDWYRETVANAVGNLMPAEAAQLSNDIGWDVVIIGHNDLYPNNAIANGQIVDAFDRYAPRQKYKFLQPGELYYYVR